MFLVVIKDRHDDDEYILFVDGQRAIDYAASIAGYYKYTLDDEEAEEDGRMMKECGYVFYRTTSCEGDRVEVHEIDFDDVREEK